MRLYLCIPVIHFSRVMLKESELKVQILEFRASSLASRPKMDRWGKGRGCKRAWAQHITKTQGATHLILISLNLYQEASFKNAHSLLLRKSFKLDDREKASGRWTSGSMMWGKVSALKFSWFQWEFTFRKPVLRKFTVLVLDTFPLSLMTSWLPTRPGYYRVPAACWEKTKVIGSWISHESRLSIACKRGNWCLAVWCTTGLLPAAAPCV